MLNYDFEALLTYVAYICCMQESQVLTIWPSEAHAGCDARQS